MYTPIIGTLGYILSPDGQETLLVHRNARTGDQHLGKYNGLGGKMHPDEDVVGCMRREIREESGLECTAMQLRGTINWTGFGPDGENWLGFIFLITAFSGTPLARNEFICWVESAERDQTRQLRITRTKEELLEGKRRPCCWPGCDHREKTGHWSGGAVQRRLCARKARAGWISTSSTNGWWSRPLPTSLPS